MDYEDEILVGPGGLIEIDAMPIHVDELEYRYNPGWEWDDPSDYDD